MQEFTFKGMRCIIEKPSELSADQLDELEKELPMESKYQKVESSTKLAKNIIAQQTKTFSHVAIKQRLTSNFHKSMRCSLEECAEVFVSNKYGDQVATRVRVVSDVELPEIVDLIDVYHTLGLNLDDKFELRVLDFVAHNELKRNATTSLSSPEAIIDYARRWDLTKDNERVQSCAERVKAMVSASGFVTEGGEEFTTEIFKEVDNAVRLFTKRAQRPSEVIGVDDEASPHLRWILEQIANVAFELYQNDTGTSWTIDVLKAGIGGLREKLKPSRGSVAGEDWSI